MMLLTIIHSCGVDSLKKKRMFSSRGGLFL